jgi:hypothetical protein
MRETGVTRTLEDLTKLRKKLERKIWWERNAFWRARQRKWGNHLTPSGVRGWHPLRQKRRTGDARWTQFQ